MNDLSQAEKEELAVTYATLILHDDGVAITADKISQILAAAKVTVQPFWAPIFEKALNGKDVGALIASAGGSGGAGGAGGSAGGADATAAEDAPAEEEEEEEEEFGLGGLF